MQAPPHASPPAYPPPGVTPPARGTRFVGAILLLISLIFFGVGGALTSYCQIDAYGFCYYPDAGAGWGLIFLGLILFIVAAVLLAMKPKVNRAVVPMYAQAPPALSFNPGPVSPTYPTPPTPPPPSPSPAAPSTPYCGMCGRPTTYVPQYGRFYCYACARYV